MHSPNDEDRFYKLKIDKLRLDDENASQADNFGHWARKYAESLGTYEAAKYATKLAMAEIREDIRERPAIYGLEKIGKLTVDVVDDCMTRQMDYKEAKQGEIKALTDMEFAKGMRDAFTHKKASIANLVELWVREYYSDAKFGAVPVNSKATEDLSKSEVRSRGARRERDEEIEKDVDSTDAGSAGAGGDGWQ